MCILACVELVNWTSSLVRCEYIQSSHVFLHAQTAWNMLPGKSQMRDLPGSFQADRIFPGLSDRKLPGCRHECLETSRKDAGRKLAWISGYPSWKFPVGMPGGKVPLFAISSCFPGSFLEGSWKHPGSFQEVSRLAEAISAKQGSSMVFRGPENRIFPGSLLEGC